MTTILLILFITARVKGDDKPNGGSTSVATPDAGVAEASSWQLPAGGADELLQFIRRQAHPAARIPQHNADDIKDAMRASLAMVDASDRILDDSAGVTGPQQGEAFFYQTQGLELLAEYARRRREKVYTQARQNAHPGIYLQGWEDLITERTGAWQKLDEREKVAFYSEIIATMPDAEEAAKLHLAVIELAVRYVGYESPADAARLLEQARPQVAECDFPSVADRAAVLDAMIRRYTLPGHPIELTGTTLAGDQFALDSLAGKVVLIDFWATWCAPCVREFTNVEALYDRYHSSGFEVVGVALDDSPDDVRAFLDQRALPWVNIVSGDPAATGFDTPIAKQYGITSIPTAILVGRDGNVISITARGAELRDLLEAHLHNDND